MEKVIKINDKILSGDELKTQLGNENMPEWKTRVFQFILEWFNDEPYIRQQTSGSTGAPKEVELPKSGMAASAKNTLKFFNLKENDTAWLCLPLHYIAGKMMVVRAVIGRLNLVLTEPASTPEIPQQYIEFTSMVPMQVHSLLSAGYQFKNISKMIIGGAAVDHHLAKKIKHIPAETFATYGMTETASHIALQKINGQNPDDSFHVLPGYSVSKNNENCLVVEAPQFSDKPMHTTDIVELISTHEFRWLGRADNVINSGGIKISPEPLEAKISSLLGRECIISSVSDKRLGKKIILVLEGNKADRNDTHILEKISEITDKHHTPKAVFYLDSFPRNSSMKINRLKINEMIRAENQD
jgi:O-succinylbenzoic acid--CoA ligase